MRLTATAKAIVLACETIPAHDGYKERHQIAIMQGAETATLSCTKEVVDMLPQPFTEYGIVLALRDYRGDNLISVSGLIPIAPAADTTAAPPAGKK